MIEAFTQLLLEHFSIFPQSIAEACDTLVKSNAEPTEKVVRNPKPLFNQ